MSESISPEKLAEVQKQHVETMRRFLAACGSLKASESSERLMALVRHD